MARARWFDPFLATYREELSGFGLYIDDAVVAELLTKLVASTAKRLGVSEVSARRYLRHDDVKEMARQAAVSLASEQPGADLLEAARSTIADAHDLGLALAGVAVAGRILRQNDDRAGADDCLGLVATAGLLLVDAQSVPLSLPSGWFHRVARFLERAADELDEGGQLPDAESTSPAQMAGRLRDDARRLRSLTDTD